MLNENINKVLFKANWIGENEDIEIDLTNENLNIELTLFNTLCFKINNKMLEMELIDIPKEFQRYVINFSLSKRTVRHIKTKINDEVSYNLLYLTNVLSLIKFDELPDYMKKLRDSIISYIIINSFKNVNLSSQFDLNLDSEEFTLGNYVNYKKNVFYLDEHIEYSSYTNSKLKLSKDEREKIERKINNYLNRLYSKAFSLNKNIESEGIGTNHLNIIDYTFGGNYNVLINLKDKFYKFKYAKPLIRKSILFIYSFIAPLKLNSFFNPLYMYCLNDTFKNSYSSNWSSLYLFPDGYSISYDMFEEALIKDYNESSNHNLKSGLIEGDMDGDDLRVLNFLHNQSFPGKTSILQEDYRFFNIIPTFIKNDFKDLRDFSLNINENLVNIYKILSILPLTSILFNSIKYTNYKVNTENILNIFNLSEDGIIIKGKPFISINSISHQLVEFEYNIIKDKDTSIRLFNLEVLNELNSIIKDTEIKKLFNQFFKDLKNRKIETFDYKYFKMLIELAINDLLYFKYEFDKEYNKFHIILTSYNTFSSLYRLDPSIDYNITTNINKENDKYTVLLSNNSLWQTNSFLDYSQTVNSYSNNLEDKVGIISEKIFLKDLLILLQIEKVKSLNHIISNKILLGDLDFSKISNEFKERVVDFKFVSLNDYKRNYFDLESKICEYRTRLFEPSLDTNFSIKRNLILQSISDNSDVLSTESSRTINYLDLNFNNIEDSIYNKNFIMDNVCIPQLNYKKYDIFINLNQMFTNVIKTEGIEFKNVNNIFKSINFNKLNDYNLCNYYDILNRELNDDIDNIIGIFKEIGYLDLEFKRIDNFRDKFQMIYNLEKSLNAISNFIVRTDKEGDIENNYKDKINLILSLCKILNKYPNLYNLNFILRNEILNNKEGYINLIKKLTRTNLFSSLKIITIIINTIIFHRNNSIDRLNKIFSQSEIQFLILSKTSNHNNILYDLNNKRLESSRLNSLSEYSNEMRLERDIIKHEFKNHKKDDNVNYNLEELYFNSLSTCIDYESNSLYFYGIVLLTQSLTFSEFINLLSKTSIRDIHNHLEPLIISYNSSYIKNSLLGTKNEINYFIDLNKDLHTMNNDVNRDKISIHKYDEYIYNHIYKYDSKIISIINSLYNRKNYNLELYKILLTTFRIYFKHDYDLLNSKLKEMDLKDFIKYFNDYYLSSFIYKDFLNMNIEDILEKRLDIVDYENKNIKVHFHKHDDPICIKLGDITNCCQTVNGVASSSVREGLLNPYSGFISVQKEGKIIAQSWIWLDVYKNILVLDSVESRYSDLLTIISKALHEWSKLQKYHIAIGCRYTKLDKDFMSKNNWKICNNYNNYKIFKTLNEEDVDKSLHEQVNELNKVIDYYNEIINKNGKDFEFILKSLNISSIIDKYKENMISTIRLTNRNVYTDASSDLFINFSEDNI